ncbi:hypothetical protein FS837_000109 [Tulasnella sp. UAMH 9824]|nr:hypothetical protein FS837_000109 [Tulasnella sp. UAMH 9824]
MALLSAALLMEKAEALKRGEPSNTVKVTTTQNGRVYAPDKNQKQKPRSVVLKRKEAYQQTVLSNSTNIPITTLPIFSAPSSIDYNVAKFKPKRLDQKLHLSSFTSSVTIERRNIFAEVQDPTNTTNTKPIAKGRTRVKKNATWRVYPENNSSIRSKVEMNPWVIDDTAGKQKWVGQLNGENDGEYWAVLTRHANYFEFTPLNRLYEFSPMDQVIGKKPETKAPSATLSPRTLTKRHLKRSYDLDTTSLDSRAGLSRDPIYDHTSEFGEGGDIDELGYEKDPSDDEEGYGHDGLTEDADVKNIRERMRRALILDTDGGKDRTKELDEEQAAHHKDLIRTFKVVAKHFNPDAETDHYDEYDEDEDDMYSVKYRQVDSGAELSPTPFLLGVQPQKATAKRLTPVATTAVTSLISLAAQTPEKGKKSSYSSYVGVPKKDFIKMPDSRADSSPHLPVSGASSVSRVAVKREKSNHPHYRHRHNFLPTASSLATGDPMPAKRPSQASQVSASSDHSEVTKRKEVQIDKLVMSIGETSPNPTSSPVDPNPSPTKKKKTNNVSRPPCPTFDDLINLLRNNGGSMEVEALRRRYQTRKYQDSREILTQFVKNSQFVATSKTGPKKFLVRLKPQHMQP